MESCCLVLIAGNRAQSIEDRTDPSPDNLAKPRTTLKCSAYQLEQLVGEQGDHAKHQVQRDFYFLVPKLLLGNPPLTQSSALRKISTSNTIRLSSRDVTTPSLATSLKKSGPRENYRPLSPVITVALTYPENLFKLVAQAFQPVRTAAAGSTRPTYLLMLDGRTKGP